MEDEVFRTRSYEEDRRKIQMKYKLWKIKFFRSERY